MGFYYIDSGYAYGGLETNLDGIVIKTPPIFKKLIGQHIKNIRYLIKKIN